jgi:imidazoleglycerol-phosphate dehydratase
MSDLRSATINRATNETKIDLTLNLDGSGIYQVDTGMPFLDHMLHLFTRHGGFDLTLKAAGDLEVDGHHTAEDIGICLGQALRTALGDKRGINRYGNAIIPMDEALLLVAVDLSGRGYLAFDVTMPQERIGNFDCELVEEFCRALAYSGAFNLHIRMLAGKNTHHIIEGLFKALARALREAVEFGKMSGLPSTKGVL